MTQGPLLSITLFAATLLATGVHAEEETRPIGDADSGATLFARHCASCHQVGAGAENRIGPHLNNIFGRKAGEIADYRYSEGLARMGADGLVWTFDTLDPYLENPRALVSRTRMNFAGLDAPEDRADVLAYLRVYSADPANIPEAEPTALPREVDLPPETLEIVGDPAYGEYLSSECTTCHRRDGADEGIPAITGWPEEDFVVAMHAYKRKIRPHPVMQMMAGRLSDEEIAALAAYFAEAE
ncbi:MULTISPECIES: c-type cytochrome [unclassified Rhodosalinus]|uniref:c-type cytochrome n=1 Tax=unclassified Rhodosalinus TaxID=2630183 RepID=UPI003525B389